MCKFKDLTNELGYTYLDRFYEKLAYLLSENLNKDVSALKTISLLAEEMSFTDDGYLCFLVEQEHPIDPTDDIRFRLEGLNNDGYYSLKVEGEEIGLCDSLSSVVKGCIEDFFI